MSSRARRVADPGLVGVYDWNGTAPAPLPLRSEPALLLPPAPPPIDPAQIEREAFTKGYAQGERAGAEAAAARGDAVVRRLAQTVDELRTLRADLLRKTEDQVVHLALAIARRIIHREVTLDRELVVTMARVALDRLQAATTATIRLHPDDYAAVMAGRGEVTSGNSVTSFVPDPMVRRGACLVQSDFGVIDVGVDAQVQEIAKALFGDADGEPPLDGDEVLVAR
jgi:flagellar assembly protein FliH